MRYLLIALSIILSCMCGASAAVIYTGSSPDGSTFQTTSVSCTVTALSVPVGGAFFFYHSDTLQFTSSTTVALVSGTDYTRSDTTVDISYTYSLFNEGSDNWYKWGYINGATDDESQPYNVIVAANQVPVITIIQPDNNGFAGTNTYFEILITDEGLGIDETSLSFSLADSAGLTVFSFSGNSQNLYDPLTGKLTYSYPQSLASGGAYTLTVSAQDLGYRAPYALTVSKTALFSARADDIADLIPVPSPFDPGKESCVVRYVLNAASDNIEINIYDMSSRLVRNIVRNASRSAGQHSVDTWDGRDYAGEALANGIYFIEVSAGTNKRYSSVILMRK